MQDILSDPRFANVASDPRFRNASNKEVKVQIDNRFEAALTNENFNTKPYLDSRGKPKKYSTKEKLNKFYDLPSPDTDEEKDEAEKEKKKKKKKRPKEVLTEEKSTKKVLTKKNGVKKNEVNGKSNEKSDEESLFNPELDLARGELLYSDDSSDDDSTTTEEGDNDQFEVFEWGELDGDAQWDCDGVEVEETNRFAVCDMDWDRIKAVDLMVLFASFAPAGGVVQKVAIYPSEFGKTRLKEEEEMGPQELVRLIASSKKIDNHNLDHLHKLENGTVEDSSSATAQQIEALRRYQRNRLRYFYAVVDCDTLETSRIIYKECDRTHYEVAGVTIDLRYIPTGMEFDEVPHDECDKVPDSYESEAFQTTALLDAKPTLTWDETDFRRKKTMSAAMAKALKKENFDEDALNDYVACSDDEDEEYDDEEDLSDEEEEDDGEEGNRKDNTKAKFRALISEIEEKERKKHELTIDMEDEFELEDSQETPPSDSEVSKPEGETPFEKFLVKKREKRKEKEKKKKAQEEEAKSQKEDLQTQSNNPKSKSKRAKKREAANKQNATEINSDLALLVPDKNESEKDHFDMRKIRKNNELNEKKRKSGKQNPTDNFKIDSSDPRFSAVFSHGSFNLDPSHTKYDPHSAFNVMNVPKRKKMEEGHKQITSASNLEPDVSSLIRKLKSKTSKGK